MDPAGDSEGESGRTRSARASARLSGSLVLTKLAALTANSDLVDLRRAEPQILESILCATEEKIVYN